MGMDLQLLPMDPLAHLYEDGQQAKLLFLIPTGSGSS